MKITKKGKATERPISDKDECYYQDTEEEFDEGHQGGKDFEESLDRA